MDVPLELNYKNAVPFKGSHYQEKYWVNNNYLVKIDSKYKESTKEVDAYKVGKILGVNVLEYQYIKVMLKGKEKNACVSKNFLHKNEKEINMYDLYSIFGYIPDYKISAINYINITIDMIHELTKISKSRITKWLYAMLIFDYIICNTDRNTSNISIIYNKDTKRYRLAPYFDNGISFLGTNQSLKVSEFKIREAILESRPFSRNFIDNLGDKGIASRVYSEIMEYCNKNGGVKEGVKNINYGHARTVLGRVEELNNILL